MGPPRRPSDRGSASPPSAPETRGRGATTSKRVAGLRPDSIAALESQSREIRDPVEKLRFLRRSLERFERVDHRLQAVPGAPLRWLAARLTGVEAARPLFSKNPNGAIDPPTRTRTPLSRRARRAINAALLLLVAAAGIALAGYPRSRPILPVGTAAPSSASLPARTTLPPVAEALPAEPRSVVPERIWQVDSGPRFELYSNGLRIDTSYAVAGDRRRYHVFDLERGLQAEEQERPIGIVFHTSESDIWPLEESFNGKLRDSSQNLLHYLQKNRVYHYLIDRFGQVFRVVTEETKANHAGVSIWSVDRRVYLNLNGPTIGVSFETRWEGGHALPITRAQLEAGRGLTDYLRNKWAIAAEMCLAHGLASVNSKKHLIGHHVDWARGFPFAAYGLPDQYQRASPAVALFGFDHDDAFVARMGEPWPGVAEAERSLAAEAEREGIPLGELRRERTRTYDRWLSLLAAAEPDVSGTTSAEAQEPRHHPSGG